VNIISIALTAKINNVGASAELIGSIVATVILGVGLAFFGEKARCAYSFPKGFKYWKSSDSCGIMPQHFYFLFGQLQVGKELLI
jgi:hypothetical protein